MQAVLKKLLTHELFAKENKCLFAQHTIEYLGHLLSDKGVQPDDKKIQAMLGWPIPLTLKQLRGFLDLTVYYRRFVRHHATFAGPLTDALRKHFCTWNDKAQEVFLGLKEDMPIVHVLTLPDFTYNFTVETNASNVGIGAVLMQSNHPIAFYSHKLSSRMQQASTYVKELFAIT